MIEYQVGMIPTLPATFLLKDELDESVNIVGYDGGIELEMIGTDNEVVDLTGVRVEEIQWQLGMVSVTWPKDRVIFDRHGKYLVRLILKKRDGTRDITRTGEIRVRDFGRIKN